MEKKRAAGSAPRAGSSPTRERSRAKAPNRRGSPEAVEKRRAARLFNDLLGGGGARVAKLDGRTEKRRQRLLKELEEGKTRGTRPLKPIDILQHVHELLELGEPLRSIRKVAKIKRPPVASENVTELLGRLHGAYRFRVEAYKFVGIDDAALRAAGILATEGRKRRSA
jgi:hypothetical protein